MSRKIIVQWMAFIVTLSMLTGCSVQQDHVKVPDWSDNATMYEVNIRQYTQEGTFKAFEEHLPRLKEMGIKILWFMPIYPISMEKRLGSLGSYYAIADYQGINPEFGTKEDFQHLVDTCHEMGFKVILDWVANHTGWDNAWIRENPDWYTKNAEGEIIYPETWEDVADLNFESKDMQNAMIKAMSYWVKEFDVDGYRCDYAGGVPLDFWENVRTKLDRIKPVYMLAEDDRSMAFLKYAFNSNYGWSFYHDLNNVAKGTKKASSLASYFKNKVKNYPD
ncbi:MAG: 1,4-alpha-glucan branching enzyme, partial [Herbinix sp.]|nr:1,4-alpha-glucan branching enzyme [Herbinix sp.]